MMRRYLLILVLILSEAIFALPCSYGNGLEVTLRLPKQKFSLGETVHFRIELRNISSRPLLVLPQPRIFPADNFQFRGVTGGKQAEILRYGEQSLNYPRLAKEVSLLKANQSIAHTIEAKVSSELPAFYNDTRPGPYLIFPGSAIRLPGFGRYQVKAVFHLSPHHPLQAFLPPQEILWHGDSASEWVVVDFTPKA